VPTDKVFLLISYGSFATTAKFVVRTLSAAWCRDDSLLTSPWFSSIKAEAAVAATRGDLGQLAPRKKLLKSFSSFPDNF
jgi:hypothetical protein